MAKAMTTVLPLRRATGFVLFLLLLAGRSVSVAAAAAAVGDDEWDALNATVSGRLGRAEPLARPCFATYRGAAVPVDAAACAAVRANYTANAARVDVPGAYMQQQGEACLAEPADQCLLDSAAVLPAPAPGAGAACGQGSVPDRYLEVRSAADVAAALAFARAHRGDVPLAVKNSGHDYMTRSSGRGALALWLHRLKGLAHHDAFTPAGCAESVGRALTAAAGELTGDALVFANAHNSTLVAGYSPTIALSGGWVLGGGHSVLSPAYGLGADRVVEFDVVTPDGVRRTANACQHADLFRALRGAGVGGAFGVVLAATHRLEPRGPVAVAQLALPAAGGAGGTTVDTALAWIELQARASLRWGREGWGGHVTGTSLTHVNPLPAMTRDSTGAAAAASMRDATAFVLAHGGTSVVEVLPDYLAFWDKYVVPGAAASAGQMRVIGSRLVPRALFADEAGIAALMAYVRGISSWFDVRRLYVPVGTPFVAADAPGRPAGDPGTAVTPAWYGALWSLANGVTLPWNSTYDQRLQTLTQLTRATRQAEQMTGPAGGAYVNEANPFTENWREAWWGDNYDFLLGVKRKYDPDHLFNCWKCVGFEDEDVASDRFRCQGKLQEAIVEQLEGQ